MADSKTNTTGGKLDKATTDKLADKAAEHDRAAATEERAAEDRDLRAENERLKAENDRLRTMVNEAAEPGGHTARPVAVEPSYGMSEGQRADIEMNGVTTSPFTGRRQTAEDLPDGVEIAQPTASKSAKK